MENLSKKPAKGILKQSSSFEQADSAVPAKNPTDVKWNEMNILQTLHPADKDYGLMKIEEPKTPYSYATGEESDAESASTLDPDLLSRKVRESQRRADSIEETEEDDDEGDEDEELTEEERQKRREFEMKRKSHYNEFQAVKLARQLLEEEDDDDESNNETTKDGQDTAPATSNGNNDMDSASASSQQL